MYIFLDVDGMFGSALENELILKNPVTKAVKCTSGKKSKETRVLTVEEQKRFLETVKETSNYNQYAFLLQTGLRTGEMIGLKWSDVDFEKKVIHIQNYYAIMGLCLRQKRRSL